MTATSTFKSVATGLDHTCALTEKGEAYCWGSNDFGELGNFDQTDRITRPGRAGGPRSVFAQLAAGPNRTCGLAADGRAYCWGQNYNGMLGNGGDSLRTVPTAVAGDLRFQSISLGYNHTCGLVSTGDAYCWGTNTFGQLGDGSTEPRKVPTKVIGDRKYRFLSAGGLRTCGVAVDGKTYCWGQAFTARLGQAVSDSTSSKTPTLVEGALFQGETR